MEAAGYADEEEESANVEGLLNTLSLDTEGTEEGAAERIYAALQMEVYRDGEGEGEGNREEGGLWDYKGT